jgi:hypothetical protein
MRGQPTAEEMSAAGLSEEEMAAINDTEAIDSDGEPDVIDEMEDDEPDDDESEGDEPEGDDDPSIEEESPDDVGDDPIDTDKPADDKAVIVIPADIPDVTFIPRLTGEILPEFQAQIDELDSKFEEGEIDYKIHRAEVRKVEAASQNAELSNQQWTSQQEAFFKHNPEFVKNHMVTGAFNTEVIRLAKSPESEGLNGIQILYVARDNVKTALSALFGGAPVKKDAEPQKKSATVITMKPKANKQGPQTIGNVPSADLADVGGDKFAHIDKLIGLDQERALARLSPADQEAYLAGVY